DFAGHGGDLVSESCEGVDHAVDGVGQLGDFAFRFDQQLALQVTVSHCGDDFGNAAHLVGEVGGHEIDVVRKVFPSAGNTAHVRLAAQFSFGADFAGDTRHLGSKGAELVHHRVNGVLELEDFAFDIDGDFLREVAVGDSSGDGSDIADLAGEVPGHGIDRVGEVFPGAGDPFDIGLSAEFSFGADFARNAGHFSGEG